MIAESILMHKINFIHFSTIESTNGWAKKHLSSFPKDQLTLITADEQSAGYGQNKRYWLAPKEEGLCVSFCFYAENADGFVLTRYMAESLLGLLQQHGVKGQIKWPNDILVEGKKIAGILTEMVDHFVIIGVGCNVNMPESTLKKIDQPATSLYVLTHKMFSTKELLTSLVEFFANISKLPVL